MVDDSRGVAEVMRSSPSRWTITSKWPVGLALGGVLLLAAGLRLYQLDKPPLSNDEAFSWRLTQYPVGDVIVRVAQDGHAPGHFLLLKAWVAVAGAGPIALRLPSVLFGLAGVVMSYFVVIEALRRRTESTRPGRVMVGGLFAAALLAVNASQVGYGRTARMYSEGVFFAALTAWLLLKALNDPRGALRWWTAYGVAVAAFCYMHHFAWFTICAQAAFVAAAAIRQRRFRCREPVFGEFRGAASGFVFGLGLALALYSPWLPVFLHQTQQVREGFWIPDLSRSAVGQSLFAWTTGATDAAPGGWHWWLVGLLSVAALTAWQSGRGGWFLLAQAAIPWMLCLGFSRYSGQSILQDRYLAFAQLSMIGLWGVTVASQKWWPPPVLGAVMIGAFSVGGCWTAIVETPTEPSAESSAMEFLRQRHQVGDLVLVASAAEVNHVRYYARRAGIDDIDVRCRLSFRRGPGIQVHVASLDHHDVFRDDALSEGSFPRIWTVARRPGFVGWAAAGRYSAVVQRTFDQRRGKSWTVTLFVIPDNRLIDETWRRNDDGDDGDDWH